MKDQAKKLFDSEGTQAALEFLQIDRADPSPAEQVQLFIDVMRHAYWKKKDLQATIQIGQAGIAAADKLKSKHPDMIEEINSKVKGIHYDIASFTWPGWDEEDIHISPQHLELGLQAAKNNLALAIELKKEHLPLSRAYWMLAAQELANRQYEQAAEHFGQAELLATKADVSGEALLAKGFILVVGLLQDPQNEIVTKQLEDIKTVLRKEEHGKFFIAQLVDSLSIFGS